MPFEYRGDIAPADVAFDARAESLEALFKEAASATMKVMVDNLAAVRPLETVQVKLEQTSLEMLLFDFLNELIFYKDARRLILLPEHLVITNEGETYTLETTPQGELIDSNRHELNTDVKAVTMLRFALFQDNEGWRATVVLDV